MKQATESAISNEQGELPIHEVRVAYSDPHLVQAATPQDAVIALYARFGHGRQFNGDELAAYVNVKDVHGNPVHSLPMRKWLEQGREYVEGVNNHCIGCAEEQGLKQGTAEWDNFVFEQRNNLFGAVGIVA